MKESKVAKALGDGLSDLPEEILCHILEFLPAQYAVSTSVLSSRWKHVYKGVPKIESVIKEICMLRENRETIASLGVKIDELEICMTELNEASNSVVKSEKRRSMRGILEAIASIRVKLSDSPLDLRRMLNGMDAVVRLGEYLASGRRRSIRIRRE